MTKEQMKFVVPEGFELKIIDEDILNPDKQWEGWYDGALAEIFYGDWSVEISVDGELIVFNTENDDEANNCKDLNRMAIFTDKDFSNEDFTIESNPWFDLGFLKKNGERCEKYFSEAGKEWPLPMDYWEADNQFLCAIECAVGLLKENKRLEEEANNA